MKKKQSDNRSKLLKELIIEYDITSISELQSASKDLFAGTMEDMLKGELDAPLGYEKHNQSEKPTTNRRNGSYKKTVRSNLGEIELAIPRDRQGEYEPQLIPIGQKDVSELEEKVMSIYAKGLSDRDISATIGDIYGFSLSHETISRIIDRVMPRVVEWQMRPLQPVYTFIYVDALMG